MTDTARPDAWFATVETWFGKHRGVITRPWPKDSYRLGRQRIVCPHNNHITHALALACAKKMAADRA